MTFSIKRLPATVFAALLALTACGETPAANKTGAVKASAPSAPAKVAKEIPAATAEAITRTLEKNYADQDLKVVSINPTPINSLYEVVVSGKQIVYTDATGEYMLVGDLIQTAEGRSLTEERKTDLNAIDFNALPLGKAVKEVRGKGSLKIAVFSDPDCPFCKRLEKEFGQMNDITIYNFMMPIASLHPQAHQKSVQIWCQKDRTAAWTNWMRKGEMPPAVAECDNPVEETTSLGEQLGFTGTPAVIFPNGKVQAGYSPKAQLEQAIRSNQK